MFLRDSLYKNCPLVSHGTKMDDEPDPTQRTTKEMAKKMAQERAAFLRNQQQQKLLDSQQPETKISLLEQHLVDLKRKREADAEEEGGSENPKKRKRSDKDREHKKKSKHGDKKSKKDKHKKHKKDKKEKKDKKDKKEPQKMEPYWDRERDLDSTKFNEKRRNAIIQSAADLNDKFGDSGFL